MKRRITVTIDENIISEMQETYLSSNMNLSKTVELLLSVGINKVEEMKKSKSETEVMAYLLTQVAIVRNRKKP